MRDWFKAHTSQLGLASLILGGFVLLVALTLSITPVAAAPYSQEDQPTNESCLGCHQQEGMTADIGGQPLPVTIDPQAFSESVHGMENLACVDCHSKITGLPHPEVTASSLR